MNTSRLETGYQQPRSYTFFNSLVFCWAHPGKAGRLLINIPFRVASSAGCCGWKDCWFNCSNLNFQGEKWTHSYLAALTQVCIVDQIWLNVLPLGYCKHFSLLLLVLLYYHVTTARTFYTAKIPHYMLNINFRPNHCSYFYFAERAGLCSYLQTWWMCRKLLPMLPLSNVCPRASTWYLTGVLFCRAVAIVVQPAGPAAVPSLLWVALHPAEIELSPSCNLYPGFSWDGAGSHRHQHHCVNPATRASSQNSYVFKRQLGDVVQGAILALPQIPDARNLVHGLDQDRQRQEK